MSDLELNGEEDAPLLPSDQQQRPSELDPHCRITAARWQVSSPRTIVYLAILIKFFTVTSGMLLLVPLFRIIEDTICHVHYNDDSNDFIEEKKCKVQEVQARLAYLLGWFGLVSSVISLVVAFPYGTLADKIGRKPTLLLAAIGVYSSFGFSPLILGALNHVVRRNPYILMLGYIFLLIGGGVPVLISMLYAIVTDVSTQKEKARNFLYLTFGATAGGLLGPLLAGILMEAFNPWIPVYVAIASTPVMLFAVLLIPETMHIVTKATADDDESSGLESVRTHVFKGLKDLTESFQMLKDVNVPLILVTFFVQTPRFAAYTSTLQQHISTHFGWTLAQTSVLLSPYGLLNLLILALLPVAGDILTSPRFGYSIARKDLFLTQISSILLVAGDIIEGFSQTSVLFLFGLFVQTLGAADSPLARATLVHYFDPVYTSRMYALLGMAEILGSFIGGPVLAILFDIGLQKRKGWIGLPWFYVAALCSLALVALFFVRLPRTRPVVGGDDEAPVGNDDDIGI